MLSNIDFFAGRCWPLDIALWDLAGKIEGAPVYEMLGGKSGVVKTYASTGSVRSPKATAAQMVRLLDLGFSGIKLRFKPDRRGQDDLEKVRAALEVLEGRA